jgi:hypothetical protein
MSPRQNHQLVSESDEAANLLLNRLVHMHFSGFFQTFHIGAAADADYKPRFVTN